MEATTTERLTREARLLRLDTMIVEGRIIRKAWRDLSHGVERACLLAALSPECGEQRDASVCPASVMPKWLANLTTSLDDDGSIEAWPGMVRRYADLARRWHALDAAAWRRLDFAFRAISVREVVTHVDAAFAPIVMPAIDAVLALHDREAGGEHVTEAAWSAAESAAWSAAWSAAESAAESAARSAAWDRMTVALFDAIEREIAMVS